MSLQQALDDCLIDFDRRVLVTDLLEEYKLTYKEAHDALEAHIKEQERASATKYEKRFLVHGLQRAGDGDVDEARELFKIVQGEDKLKEWLGKLQNSQAQLYSVEIAGGSKSAAPIFKPMQQVQVKLAKLEHRAGASTAKPTSNGTTEQTAIKPVTTKVEPKAETAAEEPKKASPSEQQKGKGKGNTGATKKGGINSFFSAAPAAKTQQQQPKETKPAASGNSMENFFKKQPAAKKSPPTESVKKELPAASNTSVQLFDVESEDSSDEEEKLDKLRRKVVGDGNESDEVGDSVKKANSKRRRISDSEDEEQPQKKSAETSQQMKQKDAEKKREEEEEVDVEAMDVAEAETATNETFLDDDGFVITVRPKKQMQQKQPAKKKTSPKAAAAATSAASSAPSTKKKSPTAAASKSSIKETPKTKQGNIMSFFSKK